MSRETIEGVMMRCKTITANLLVIVGLLVEPITSIENPKGSLKEYLPIKQPPLTVTSKYPVILSSLSSYFSFSSMLIYNSISHHSIGYL